jgi:hypothetical protein
MHAPPAPLRRHRGDQGEPRAGGGGGGGWARALAAATRRRGAAATVAVWVSMVMPPSIDYRSSRTPRGGQWLKPELLSAAAAAAG